MIPTRERRYKSPSTFKRAWRRYRRLGRRVVAMIAWSDGTLGLVVAAPAGAAVEPYTGEPTWQPVNEFERF